jgi:hypothetical protein
VTTDGLPDRGLRCGEKAVDVVRHVWLGAEVIHWDGYPDNPDVVVLADPDRNRLYIVDLAHEQG